MVDIPLKWLMFHTVHTDLLGLHSEKFPIAIVGKDSVFFFITCITSTIFPTLGLEGPAIIRVNVPDEVALHANILLTNVEVAGTSVIECIFVLVVTFLG